MWGLGVILFELLALRRPFNETNLGALVLAIAAAARLARCLHRGLDSGLYIGQHGTSDSKAKGQRCSG